MTKTKVEWPNLTYNPDLPVIMRNTTENLSGSRASGLKYKLRILWM